MSEQLQDSGHWVHSLLNMSLQLEDSGQWVHSFLDMSYNLKQSSDWVYSLLSMSEKLNSGQWSLSTFFLQYVFKAQGKLWWIIFLTKEADWVYSLLKESRNRVTIEYISHWICLANFPCWLCSESHMRVATLSKLLTKYVFKA